MGRPSKRARTGKKNQKIKNTKQQVNDPTFEPHSSDPSSEDELEDVDKPRRVNQSLFTRSNSTPPVVLSLPKSRTLNRTVSASTKAKRLKRMTKGKRHASVFDFFSRKVR